MYNLVKKRFFAKKIYLVNRDFQMRYTGAAVMVGIMCTIITTVCILYPLYRFEILRVRVFLPLPILGVMVLAAIGNILLVGFMGLIVTHKIAGPIYSIVRFIRKIENGVWYGRMSIRKGDDLRYLVRNVNCMLDGINKLGKKDYETISRLKQELDNEAKDIEDRLEAAKEIATDLSEAYRRRLNLDHKVGSPTRC